MFGEWHHVGDLFSLENMGKTQCEGKYGKDICGILRRVRK